LIQEPAHNSDTSGRRLILSLYPQRYVPFVSSFSELFAKTRFTLKQ